jgi:hypothetical protein
MRISTNRRRCIMPGVKIIVSDAANAALNVNVNPSKVTVSRRLGLDLEWSLQATGGWEWETDGITIDEDPPSPYSRWTVAQPRLEGDVFKATAPPNDGDEPLTYKYNVKLKKGSGSAKINIDPDIGNDPPGGDQGDERGHRPKH